MRVKMDFVGKRKKARERKSVKMGLVALNHERQVRAEKALTQGGRTRWEIGAYEAHEHNVDLIPYLNGGRRVR